MCVISKIVSLIVEIGHLVKCGNGHNERAIEISGTIDLIASTWDLKKYIKL